MPKHFNTTGPVIPSEHYCIDPMQRMDWTEIHSLIADKKFFVLHAPRQTGKTSTLLAMMDTLNQSGEYTALYINVEAAQAARNDVALGMKTILGTLADGAYYRLQDDRLNQWLEEIWQKHGATGALKAILNRWAQASALPIVLMIDEVDALVGDTLISLLRQLREGYIGRPGVPFVQSVILCGVRDVRDYRIHTSHHEIITGGSAFNVKAKSLVMGSFSRAEVETLYAQHTAETGQVFSPEIFPELWEDTHGQPWLVNALGHELIWEDKTARDRSTPITLERYRVARERLIQSRATHLEQLADKLKEARVRSVIEPILKGADSDQSLNPDAVEYVRDLGLIERASNGAIRISNRIYQEVIPRELSWGSQMAITQSQAWYLTPQRRVDMPKLLNAFQQFFREHAESWLERFDYKEAGPQLLLQAFLQRIINGGGRINREYGLGRKRTDLYIEWPVDEQQGFHGEVQRIVLELKLLHKGLAATLTEGLEQTAGYADQCGAQEMYLIIFDRNPNTPWDAKIWQRQESWQERDIGVWGM
ncbi:ATP-binding protein [Thiothrix fructosivorans]|uniref:ATP-binding protein n=1 Tax=Thiothrix fructosivorans TaxID=111770 RepID=A0A8B0SF54_9GAMM|nr:ATP-binding protein [Thiothrix fructosivorans]MBO0611647.1 ATP-binding protein [Thiothrix fructosivorans]QTX10693.1 ATP-binding protein [Thiothrix fructosivorans]